MCSACSMYSVYSVYSVSSVCLCAAVCGLFPASIRVQQACCNKRRKVVIHWAICATGSGFLASNRPLDNEAGSSISLPIVCTRTGSERPTRAESAAQGSIFGIVPRLELTSPIERGLSFLSVAQRTKLKPPKRERRHSDLWMRVDHKAALGPKD